MSSKYCPACSKINSVTFRTPKYCMWCGRDLSDMPVLPHHKEWGCDANIYSQKLKTEYENKSTIIIGENGQLKLF